MTEKGFTKKKKESEKKSKKGKPSYVKIGDRKIEKNQLILVLSIVSIVALGLILAPVFLSVIQPPETTEDSIGWVEFRLYDHETKNELDGEITLIKGNDSSALVDYDDYEEYDYENPIETGESVYIPEECFAVVTDVDLDTSDDREFLPTVFIPYASDNESAPQINSVYVDFLLDDIDRANATIDELNGDSGLYNETDIESDEVNTINVNFSLNPRYNASIYGRYNWVPDYILENNYPDTYAEDVSAYGLWLCFNGTDRVQDSVFVNDYEATNHYIESLNITMILLDTVYYDTEENQVKKNGNQKVEFELKKEPEGIFFFDGFLDNIEDTKRTIK